MDAAVEAELARLFAKVGLTDAKAVETAKNKKLGPLFRSAISEAGADATDCSKTRGALLYVVASTVKGDSIKFLPYIAKAVGNDKLRTSDQIAGMFSFASTAAKWLFMTSLTFLLLAAVQYVSGLPHTCDTVNDAEFDEACGVGESCECLDS